MGRSISCSIPLPGGDPEHEYMSGEFIDTGSGLNLSPMHSAVLDSMSSPEGDDELLAGANFGSDVTVSEIVVYASTGGGHDVFVFDDSYAFYHDGEQPEDNMTGWNEWVDEVRDLAQDFATAHIQGDPSSPVYQQAHQALAALYAKAYANAFNTGTYISGPVGNIILWQDVLSGLNSTTVVIGPHSGADPAWTDVNGQMNIVYIDPNRIDPYINAFGATEGINYLVYHELGRASIWGEAEAFAPDREARNNERGQVFAEMVGAAYPDDTELEWVGGTVDRT